MDNDLIRRAVAVNQANLALGNEVFEADGATFVRNRAHASIHDANHVAHVRASSPAEIDRLVSRAETEYEGIPHRVFHTSFETPPTFEARLVLEGYTRSDELIMVLDGELQASVRSFDIGPIADEQAWEAFFALHIDDWKEQAARTGRERDEDVGIEYSRTQREKSPPVQFFLAHVDDEPRGYFNAWQGVDGVGQVESLFVDPAYRRHGIATALIAHCVSDARARGAGPVVIVADPTDTPKNMYAAMGFRPVAIKRSWRKVLLAAEI